MRRLLTRPTLVRAVSVGLGLLLVASLWPTVAEVWHTYGKPS